MKENLEVKKKKINQSENEFDAGEEKGKGSIAPSHQEMDTLFFVLQLGIASSYSKTECLISPVFGFSFRYS